MRVISVDGTLEVTQQHARIAEFLRILNEVAPKRKEAANK